MTLILPKVKELGRKISLNGSKYTQFATENESSKFTHYFFGLKESRVTFKNGNALDFRSSNVEFEELTQNVWSVGDDNLFLTLIKGKEVRQFKFNLEDEVNHPWSDCLKVI